MESEFIAWLRDRVPNDPRLKLGLGDDAAVLDVAGTDDLVVTVDLISDHVDFDAARDDPRRIGRKALAVNLSDLAAMAAEPLAAVVALLVPRSGGSQIAAAIYEGLLPLAHEYHVALAGGDTNSWDDPLAVSVTLLGRLGPRGPLRRKGAQPGDRILVTGALGGSILGKHFDFDPRVREAAALHAAYELHAGMDISDGLAIDLGRLCDESGVGAVVELASVPVAAAAHQLATERDDGTTGLDHALSDGEDFELLLALAPHEAQRLLRQSPLAVGLTDIGEFTSAAGLWQQHADGEREPLPRRGWQHVM